MQSVGPLPRSKMLFAGTASVCKVRRVNRGRKGRIRPTVCVKHNYPSGY